VSRLAVLAGLISAALVSAACSGVPTTSSPEVIRSGVGGATQAPVATISPQPGAEPRSIVQTFLDANVSRSDDKHAAAKQFLTADARTKWSDSTATVVDDNLQVGLLDASNQITVTANREGTIGSTGIYTPAVRGDGTSTEPLSLTFGLVRVAGQWRINSLQPGVVVTESQLEESYQLRPLYFFDLAAQRLVADPRYTPLTGQSLDSWLLNQLVGGPRQELTSAVLKLPDQFTPKTSSVTAGVPITVELTGSSQLDNDTRHRVAGQLATTLGGTQATPVRITDGGRPVPISSLPDPFSSIDFPVAMGENVVPQAFYLGDDGTVRRQDGTPLGGPLGRKGLNLTSIALAEDPDGGDNYPAAAGTGSPHAARLLVGSRSSGLRDVGLRPGPLTRPAWAPGQPEVWVGDGRTMVRVVNGAPPVVVPLSLPIGQGAGGTIRAVTFSRDGVRVAVVIAGSDGTAATYIGTVERPGKNVSVDNLVPVTPADVDVDDVAWNDDATLYVIGSGPDAYGIWSVKVDGSQWTPRSRANLPQAAQQIAAARDQFPWVAAGGAIFVQRSSIWTSPYGPPDTTVRGSSPTYLQ
jgi:Lipoprotein LpqB beta-propeller domain